MRVRIIDNLFTNTIGSLNLNNYIGQVMLVHSQGYKEGSLNVIFPNCVGVVTIYEGEFEVIDLKGDLDNYFRNHQREYNFCNDDVVDFLIDHREEIVNILR